MNIDIFLAMFAMFIFAYAIIYEFTSSHRWSITLGIVAGGITVHGIYTDDLTLLAPTYGILLLLTFILYLIRISKEKG